MTCASIASRPMRDRRSNSRSTSLLTASGRPSASSFFLQLLEVVGALALAELVLDRLELLAQVELALPVAELLAHLGLDVLLRVEHRELALDHHQDAAQPLLDRQRLEQRLALGGRELGVAGDQVGQPAGVLDVGQHLLDHFLGQAGALAQLGGALAQLAGERDEGGIVGVERRHLLRRLHLAPRDSRLRACSAPRCRGARR